MTTRASGQPPEQPRQGATPQMGGTSQGTPAQAQQSSGASPQQQGQSVPKPVRFTDWASI